MGRRILHLAGSPTSDFFFELSLVYARGCCDALAGRTRHTFVHAVVSPDGSWRFPASLDAQAIETAEPMDLPKALANIRNERIDVGLPQMFCSSGMTHYRALLDVLDIPYLGNPPFQMALAADKGKARAIVAAAGVDVPPGEIVRRGDVPTLTPPVVFKPTTSDNSDGVSLVTSVADYERAIEDALAYAETVLIERYVELGREVRCGIVARGNEFVCLPLEEYYVDPVARPIRMRSHKLKADSHDRLTLAAKEPTQSWIVRADDPIVEAVWAAAKRCHIALGCEQYSLFDFRIDPDGRPWFLEAGLYCSFSPQSVVVTMAAAAGVPLPALFEDAVDRVLRRTRRHM